MGKKILFGIFVGVLIGVIANQLDKNILMVLVFLGLVFNLLVVLGMRNRYILYLILFAFTVRVAIAIIDSNYSFISYSTQDPVRFDRIGWQIASAWKEGTITEIRSSFEVKNYSTFIALFYYFFGHVSLIIRITNSALGALTVFNVYKITLKLFDKKKAKIASAIVAVYPSIVMFSSTGLRDPLIIFLLSQYIYFAILWIKSYQIRYILLAFTTAILSGLFRPENLPILLIPLIPSVMMYFKKQLKISTISPVYIAMFAVISGFILFQILNSYGFKVVKDISLDRLLQIREYRTKGSSVYLEGLDVSGGPGLVKAIVLGGIYFIISPLPWQIHKSSEFIAAIESLFLMLIILMSIKGFSVIYKKERNISQFLILFLVLGVATYGLVNANVGTALRQRAQFIWIFLIFSSWYISKFKIKIKKKVKSNEKLR
jgi:hypothetical protein